MNIINRFSEISYYTIESISRYKKFFVTISLAIFLLNIFTPFIIQVLITQEMGFMVGFGKPPENIQYGEPPMNPVFWIAIKYSQYFQSVNIAAAGDTYWIVIYDLSTILLSIISALITGLVFTRLKYFINLTKGRCRVEKGTTALGTTLTVIGFSTIASSAVSCPSCGFTAFMTLAAVLVSASTGSLLGLSALYTTLMNTLLIIGITINIGVIVYLDTKIRKLGLGGPSN